MLPPQPPSGSGRQRRDTFDDVADIYDRVRPSYPPEFFDRIFERLPADPTIVEVGPGTGQATVGLLERGAVVTAIEPGPNLRTILRGKFPSDRLHLVDSAFEDAVFHDAAFDAVFSATAYHWIPPEARLAIPRRILKPHGVLATIDLIQVDTPEDRGYSHRVQEIYQRYGGVPGDYSIPTPEAATPVIAPQLSDENLREVEIIKRSWSQTYTAAQYRDLLTTYSSMQMMTPARREALIDELVGVISDEYNGMITRPLVAILTMVQL